MYFKDLTPITEYNAGVYMMVGWLDNEHPYPKGNVPSQFIDRLWIFCTNTFFDTYGYHYCPLCPNPSFGMPMEHNGEKRTLGDAEIRVMSKDGILFTAPNLIFHYVIDHQYYPPENFIQAVLEGPLPGSKEYRDAAEFFAWR